MKIGLLLTAVLILTSAGPFIFAAAIYGNNITWLILPPSTQAAMDDFQNVRPYVSYVGYNLSDPEKELWVFFDISNPYNVSISITNITMQCYCHEHGICIGEAEGRELPLQIPPNETGRLSMKLTFTGEGKSDVIEHKSGGGTMYLDLRNVFVTMQGVEAQFSGDVAEVGPISFS